MHLDLTTLPPLLIQPSPPSNTLLITQLTNPQIFLPATLNQIQLLLSQHAGGSILTFSPLKSMRRIIITLPSSDHAIALRRILDGEEILGCRVRVYFGMHTPTESHDQHLKAPDTGRLFFISPPPSPPQGWTMRHEDPPNKAVHADDLASALAKLSERTRSGPESTLQDENSTAVAAADMMDEEADLSATEAKARLQFSAAVSGNSENTTVVYLPDDHGSHAARGLPAVTVEDVSGEKIRIEDGKKIQLHTARPPVELMLDDDMDMS